MALLNYLIFSFLFLTKKKLKSNLSSRYNLDSFIHIQGGRGGTRVAAGERTSAAKPGGEGCDTEIIGYGTYLASEVAVNNIWTLNLPHQNG